MATVAVSTNCMNTCFGRNLRVRENKINEQAVSLGLGTNQGERRPLLLTN